MTTTTTAGTLVLSCEVCREPCEVRHLGVDHNDPEYDCVSVGELDYGGLAELDGDGVIDLVLATLRIVVGVIGRDELRSRIRTELGEPLT